MITLNFIRSYDTNVALLNVRGDKKNSLLTFLVNI